MINYKKLIKYVKVTESLSEAASLVAWDQETMMPKGSGHQRAEYLSSLENIIHSRRSSKEVGDFLSSIEISSLDEIGQSNYQHIKRSFDRSSKIPLDLATELARVTSLSQMAWSASKKNEKPEDFLKIFKEVINLKKQEASMLTDNKNLYNVLLNDFEIGMKTEYLDPLFDKLGNELIDLRNNILGKKSKNNYKNNKNQIYDKNIQMQISNKLAEVFGFNFEIGRIDISEHPFSTGSGNDVRITTRLLEDDPFNCFYSTIHEAGHAVYEQNIDKNLILTPNGHGTSMSIHESQSRLFENQLGRSEEFVSWLFKKMSEDFYPFSVKNERDLYVLINNVDKNFIRTEADELQYNLHIIMRYDLEKQIINENLNINQIEGAWNETFLKYFGFNVNLPSKGFLQDIHWSAGLFGYFPTYALGNIYAGCIFEKMKKEVPNIMQDLTIGNTVEARTWLCEKIHKYGSIKSPDNLMNYILGKKPSEKPLLDYLKNKFNYIYI